MVDCSLKYFCKITHVEIRTYVPKIAYTYRRNLKPSWRGYINSIGGKPLQMSETHSEKRQPSSARRTKYDN